MIVSTMSSFTHPSPSGNTVSRRRMLTGLSLLSIAPLAAGCGLRIDDLGPATPEPADASERARARLAAILEEARGYAGAAENSDLVARCEALLAAAGGRYVNAAETTAPTPSPWAPDPGADAAAGVQKSLAEAFAEVSKSWPDYADRIAAAIADVAAGASVLTRWWSEQSGAKDPGLEELFGRDVLDAQPAATKGPESTQKALSALLEYGYAAQYAGERAVVRLDGGARDLVSARLDAIDEATTTLREFLDAGGYQVPEPRAAYALATNPVDAGSATTLMAGIEDGWSGRLAGVITGTSTVLPAAAAWLVDSARARQDLTGELQLLRFASVNDPEGG